MHFSLVKIVSRVVNIVSQGENDENSNRKCNQQQFAGFCYADLAILFYRDFQVMQSFYFELIWQ